MSSKIPGEIISEIRSAFAEVPYPGDENIVYDNSGTYLDVMHMFEAFKGKHWREVSLETLISNRDHLSFFTPEAFRFYLPAFLIALLTHPNPLDLDVLNENTVSNLSPNYDWGIDQFKEIFEPRVAVLDAAQKKAIKWFIEWYVDRSKQYNPPDYEDHSLDSTSEFWGQY